MDKNVTDNNKIFTLFRQSEEPSFIKFLDNLRENHGKEKTPDPIRSERQSNRRSNKRQEQIVYGYEEVKTNSISLKSSEETS